MLRYTLMRLGIFVGCFVVVWGLVYTGIAPRGLGASNGMWIILLAMLISAPISFVALRKERDRASAQIAPRLDQRINRVKSNLAANRSQEDEADDEARDRTATDRTETDRAETDRAETDRAETDRAETDRAETDGVETAKAAESTASGKAS